MADTQKESSALQGVEYEGGAFAELLNKQFKPKTEEAKSAVEAAVLTLAQQAIADAQLISADVVRSIEAMIAEIDRKLSAQVNEILHHSEFQQLEGSWRGLHYLVNNSETDEMLKIRVMNIPKAELGKTLKRYKGAAWDQSPIFKKIYEEEFGQFGGEPFGALVGDYYFDHSPMDVELLGEMGKIASSAFAPFLAAVDPGLMQMGSWQELSNQRDITKIFTTPEYAGWRSLRESEDSRFIGLTMPRFLAVNINRSFKLYGWCARIRGVESGGAVEGLPTHTFPTDDGGVDMKCPTEIAITDRREAELAKNGFMPLLHRKNSDIAAFIGAQSLNKPSEYDDPDATANAAIAARLPYMFACARFSHFLKCMVRDKIGSYRERADMEKWLNGWIMNYVDGDPANSSETTKAQKPLAAAEVVVEEIAGQPGYYSSKFYLRPHYQLEGLTVSLRLVSKLPSGKKQ